MIAISKYCRKWNWAKIELNYDDFTRSSGGRGITSSGDKVSPKFSFIGHKWRIVVKRVGSRRTKQNPKVRIILQNMTIDGITIKFSLGIKHSNGKTILRSTKDIQQETVFTPYTFWESEGLYSKHSLTEDNADGKLRIEIKMQQVYFGLGFAKEYWAKEDKDNRWIFDYESYEWHKNKEQLEEDASSSSDSEEQSSDSENEVEALSPQSTPTSEDCPICMEPISKPWGVVIPCGHPFHQSCWDEVVARHSESDDNAQLSCAVCRKVATGFQPVFLDLGLTGASDSVAAASNMEGQESSSSFVNRLLRQLTWKPLGP